eukprot:5672308-Heterocapsa_arctica.AAC.1
MATFMANYLLQESGLREFHELKKKALASENDALVRLDQPKKKKRARKQTALSLWRSEYQAAQNAL